MKLERGEEKEEIGFRVETRRMRSMCQKIRTTGDFAEKSLSERIPLKWSLNDLGLNEIFPRKRGGQRVLASSIDARVPRKIVEHKFNRLNTLLALKSHLEQASAVGDGEA